MEVEGQPETTQLPIRFHPDFNTFRIFAAVAFTCLVSIQRHWTWIAVHLDHLICVLLFLERIVDGKSCRIIILSAQIHKSVCVPRAPQTAHYPIAPRVRHAIGKM